jgi:hypothetical protein
MGDSSSLPVVYIAGSSHSGSTLLDLVLGSHSKIESLGEAKKIPQVLAKIRDPSGETPLCSCREPINSCGFWSAVLRLDEGTFTEREEITKQPAADLGLARRALAFRAREVLLDSSKNLGRLRFLSCVPEFDVTCLHLTRDPRAVAFSAVRKIEKKTGPLDPKSRWRLLTKHAFDWSSLNRKIRNRYHSKKSVTYLALRYEDFVMAPESTLAKVLPSIGLKFEAAQMQFRNFTHHNIEGNRLRLQGGCEIRFDSSYLNGLTSAEWWTISLVLLPRLGRFGYSFSRRQPTLEPNDRE